MEGTHLQRGSYQPYEFGSAWHQMRLGHEGDSLACDYTYIHNIWYLQVPYAFEYILGTWTLFRNSWQDPEARRRSLGFLSHPKYGCGKKPRFLHVIQAKDSGCRFGHWLARLPPNFQSWMARSTAEPWTGGAVAASNLSESGRPRRESLHIPHS